MILTYDEALEKCKKLVLKDIEEQNCPVHWDGTVREISPTTQFNEIVNWCIYNIKTKAWSYRKSSSVPWSTSYGAKHKCERDLQCYVANNWMKLAMIYAGLDVCDDRLIEDGHLMRSPVKYDDILTNHVNFVVRCPDNTEPYNIRYNCLSPYINKNLKYNRG